MGLHVLVLAGGSGTRLWPLSRAGTPKHLLPLGPGGISLLRATLERVGGLGSDVHVVTAAAQADRCSEELRAAGLDPGGIIAEPEARGSGPALGLATATIARRDPEALIVSVHADARVPHAEAYRQAVRESAGWAARRGGIATVGLVPPYASTGMGYIEKGPRLEGGALPAFDAAGFKEKPAADVAERYLSGGRHLWNLGLFAWPAAFFLDQLAQADPGLHGAVVRTAEQLEAGDQAAAYETYRALRTVAVEPLLVERARPLTAVEASFAWSDVGSWQDLYQARVDEGGGDSAANVSDGRTLLLDCSGSGVFSYSGRQIAAVGVSDLIVVDCGDAVLVVPRGQSQRVREVVDRLREEGGGELT